ncbi:medium-chain acyl-CoA ligase ACSF2, mitochondrial-like isoform X1 [Rhipicephalus microplus]|uniref:medium-chain acyl-CoA ligase ACSF2, mitochondrial-like isoform X1 n=1 Tax=Rhipicephalus microplus TaxID=6941 RepID=UPI003F6AFCC9
MAPASPHLGIQALVDAMQGRLFRRICVPAAFRFPCSVQRRTLTKLSYYHRPGRERLFSCTVGDVIEKTADVRGDSLAIVSAHQSIRKTYAEYKKDIDLFAAALISLKLGIGSRIAIIAPNMYEWAVVLFATAKAGLVLVNVNTTYKIHELEHCLNHTDCKVVIVSEQFSKQDYYTLLLKLAPELASSRFGHLKSARLPSLKHVISIGETAKPGTVRFAELMESVTNEHLRALRCTSSKLQMDDAVNLQFTSGTTGKPKAAQLSHFNVVNNAYLVGRRLELHKQEEVICLNVPLIHCFGCIAGTISAAIFGSTAVMPAPSFNAAAALKCIAAEKCTFLYGTPTMYIDMLHHVEHGCYDVSSIRTAVVSGAPCPNHLTKDIMKKLNAKRIHVLYGTTETSPMIAANDPNEPVDQWITSVGRPLDHVEVKIVDDKNRIVPTNERGELCVRGYTVFMGYFKEDKKTKEAIRNGWYHTGDGAMMTEDGRVSILGRMRDVIVRGDEHVYPQEVEHFLYTHPAVQEVQVVGVPDEGQREEVCAWIKLKPGFSLSQEDIKIFCKKKMSHYKIPRYVLFVSEFPKTVSGKVQKHVMKEESQKILHL